MARSSAARDRVATQARVIARWCPGQGSNLFDLAVEGGQVEIKDSWSLVDCYWFQQVSCCSLSALASGCAALSGQWPAKPVRRDVSTIGDLATTGMSQYKAAMRKRRLASAIVDGRTPGRAQITLWRVAALTAVFTAAVVFQRALEAHNLVDSLGLWYTLYAAAAYTVAIVLAYLACRAWLRRA